MARIGLKYYKYKKITIGTAADGAETETYGETKTLGKAMKLDAQVTFTNTALYADDGIAESIKEFSGGTLSADVDQIDDDALTDIFGAEKDEDGGVTFRDNDTTSYIRVGTMTRAVKNGAVRYEVFIYAKVMLTPPSEGFETKGENAAFKNDTLTGDIMRNCDGVWKIKRVFATEAEASTYLDTLGVSA